jgi:hypothetical protein
VFYLEKLKKMSSISDLSVASSSSLSSYFFKEKEAFKNIKELAFLYYYKEFKLLLYSSCFSAIYSSISAFKSHLLRDLKLVPLELYTSIISQALNIFKELEVTSFKESLKLINTFSTSRNLLAFKELKLAALFICNSYLKSLIIRLLLKDIVLKSIKIARLILFIKL